MFMRKKKKRYHAIELRENIAQPISSIYLPKNKWNISRVATFNEKDWEIDQDLVGEGTATCKEENK